MFVDYRGERTEFYHTVSSSHTPPHTLPCYREVLHLLCLTWIQTQVPKEEALSSNSDCTQCFGLIQEEKSYI